MKAVLSSGTWSLHVPSDQPMRGKYQIQPPRMFQLTYSWTEEQKRSLSEGGYVFISEPQKCLSAFRIQAGTSTLFPVLHNVSKYAKHPLMQPFLPLITILSK